VRQPGGIAQGRRLRCRDHSVSGRIPRFRQSLGWRVRAPAGRRQRCDVRLPHAEHPWADPRRGRRSRRVSRRARRDVVADELFVNAVKSIVLWRDLGATLAEPTLNPDPIPAAGRAAEVIRADRPPHGLAVSDSDLSDQAEFQKALPSRPVFLECHMLCFRHSCSSAVLDSTRCYAMMSVHDSARLIRSRLSAAPETRGRPFWDPRLHADPRGFGGEVLVSLRKESRRQPRDSFLGMRSAAQHSVGIAARNAS
jgi:hypothetical protein